MSEGLTVPSEDVLKVAHRLQAIFMPSAQVHRDRVYPTQDKARFVHYTSAESALKIIQGKRLWMRNATCMVDYREVLHGHACLINAFAPGAAAGEAFRSALDKCVPGIAGEAIDLFNNHWGDIQLHTYIACVSEHLTNEDKHGRLSMWRASSTNTLRVALVMSVPWFTGAAYRLGIFFSPVAYMDEADMAGELQAVTDNISSNGEFLGQVDRALLLGFAYQMLLSGCACVKHKAFEEEREWRAVYGPNRVRSPLMELGTATIQGVPQTVCKIPLDVRASPDLAGLDFATIFDRLIVGPTGYPAAVCDAFVRELTAAGVSDAASKVIPSDIPIRSSS